MGVRKRNKAEETKEVKKQTYLAKLNNCPTSPRKMRLVVDLIRGVNVDRALHILKHSSKDASGKLEKLVRSAISNWEQKNGRQINDEDNIYIKQINVDSGRVLKRILPAPQGRAHRTKKRSNHVTVLLDSRIAFNAEESIIEKKETVKIPEIKEKTTKVKKSK